MKNRVQRKTAERKTENQTTPTAATAAPQIGAPAPADTRPGGAPQPGGEGQGTRTRKDYSARWRELPPLSPDHWTQDTDPMNEADRAAVFAPYVDHTSEDSPESAATLLCTLIERITGTGVERGAPMPDPSWEDATAELAGLYQLIRHNPHFREEAEGLRLLCLGEDIIAQFCHKANRR